MDKEKTPIEQDQAKTVDFGSDQEEEKEGGDEGEKV